MVCFFNWAISNAGELQRSDALDPDVEGSTTGGLAFGVFHRTPVLKSDESRPPPLGWLLGGGGTFTSRNKAAQHPATNCGRINECSALYNAAGVFYVGGQGSHEEIFHFEFQAGNL